MLGTGNRVVQGQAPFAAPHHPGLFAVGQPDAGMGFNQFGQPAALQRPQQQQQQSQEDNTPWYLKWGKEAVKIGFIVGAGIVGGLAGGPPGAMAAAALASGVSSAVDQKLTTGKIDWGTVMIDTAIGAIPGGFGKLAGTAASRLGIQLTKEATKEITVKAIGQQTLKRAILGGAAHGAADGAAIGYIAGFAHNAYENYKKTGSLNLSEAHSAGVSSIIAGSIGGGVMGGTIHGVVHKFQTAQVTKTAAANKTATKGQTTRVANETAVKTPPAVAEGGDPKVIALMEKLYPELERKMAAEKAVMQEVFAGLGEIQARAKKPVSGANRLQRTVDAGWATDPVRIGPDGQPLKIKEITTVDQARHNLWDALGSRLVVGDTTPEGMNKVVDALVKGIRDGKVKLKQLNNLRGPNGKPYFTAEHMQRIQDACAEKGLKVKMGNYEAAPDKSPFTSICGYLDHGDGVTGEIQIIGKRALRIADAEHLPYDAGIKKDLYRELTPAGKQIVEPKFRPFESAIHALSDEQRLLYNRYLNECYIHARNMELGVASQPPKLPEGLSSVLSIDNILHLQDLYHHTKKAHARYPS